METYRKKLTQVSEMTQQNSINQAASCSCAHPAPSGDVMGVWGHLCSTNFTGPRSRTAQGSLPLTVQGFEVKASLSRSEGRERAAVALAPPVPAKPASIC